MKRSFALSLSVVMVLGMTVGCAKTDPNATETPATTAQAGSTSDPSQSRGVDETNGTGDDQTSPGAGSASPNQEQSPSPSPTGPAPRPTVTMSAASGIQQMRPDDTVRFKVVDGTLQKVDVTDADGKAVLGTITADSWKPERNLLPASQYSAKVTVNDNNGSPVTVTKNFATVQSIIATYSIMYDGYDVGVGMPAIIQFDSAVETEKMRAEVEKHAKVTVTPTQEGSWGWLDNRQLMWRPKTYFKPGTKVTIEADLAGVQTGKNKWVKKSKKGSMSIGDQRILYTDIKNHTMRVEVNGKTIKTLPVTNGNPNYPTRSGTKVIIERSDEIIMDSETVNIPKGHPDAYKLKVYYAMRVTWTGEFVHAAPWSTWAQGRQNVSHGCTGLSTENAAWLFNLMRAGDLDIVTGSDRVFQPTEGIGVWQFTWDKWKAQSALA